MSITAPLLENNQTTLPPEVVKALKVRVSSTLIFEIKEDGCVLLKKMPKKSALVSHAPASPAKTATFGQLAGTFPKTKPGIKPATPADMDAAIARGAVIRYTKSKA